MINYAPQILMIVLIILQGFGLLKSRNRMDGFIANIIFLSLLSYGGFFLQWHPAQYITAIIYFLGFVGLVFLEDEKFKNAAEKSSLLSAILILIF